MRAGEALARAGLAPGLRLAARREMRHIGRHPALAFFVLLFPLLVFLTLASIFRAGVPTGLPVAVVDGDRSAVSRQIVRAVDAAPEVAIAFRADDLAQARRLILRGDVYGVLLLPAGLERDLRAGRRPEAVLFFNNQFMTPASGVASGVQSALLTVNAGIAVGLRTAEGQNAALAAQAVDPIPVQRSPLFNPALDYVHFLLASLMPAALQIFICAGTAYGMARERQRPGGLAGLAFLGGGLVPAVAGKLLPHTVIFCTVLGLGDALLLRIYGTPFTGSMPLYLASGLLFVLAYQLIGVALALLFPGTSLPVGAAGILTAPAFGFAGISFPRLAMNGFSVFWSGLLPLTWYMEVRMDQMLRGVPVEISLAPFANLCWLTLGAALLAAALLHVRRPRLPALREAHV